MSFTVCVFCGARDGAVEKHRQAAQAFGQQLAKREMTLVYGGGKVGLMGRVADASLALGGRVVGILPDFLRDKEVAHENLGELLIVDDLLERKAMMIERSDAFVALPGGIGTYDELLEVIAWRQLRQLRQPIGLLNSERYFAPFLDLLTHGVNEGFIGEHDIDHLVVDDDPVSLLDALLEAP